MLSQLFPENSFVVIAGPCAIESYDFTDEIACLVKDNDLHFMRGGAYKPRTSPQDFQGLGLKGLQILCEVAKKYHLKTVSEATSFDNAELVAGYADIIQIGSRNMTSYALVERIGQLAHRYEKSVLLKRGMAATIEEWLLASEYLGEDCQEKCILCERGIRTFESATRFTLDISSIPVLKKACSKPVIVDVSHAAGSADLVIPLALAACAVGAAGVMVEVHPSPASALCDGNQSLAPEQFEALLTAMKPLVEALGKTIH